VTPFAKKKICYKLMHFTVGAARVSSEVDYSVESSLTLLGKMNWYYGTVFSPKNFE